MNPMSNWPIAAERIQALQAEADAAGRARRLRGARRPRGSRFPAALAAVAGPGRRHPAPRPAH